jgi:hypothetical protein
LPVQANAFEFTPEVCARYGLGKNWYCGEANDPDEQPDITANDILSSGLPPAQKAIKLNELWELQRKTAVITRRDADIYKLKTAA